MLINMNNYTGRDNHTFLIRKPDNINYIVIHFVGAFGNAKANINYYSNNNVGASADYFVNHNGTIEQFHDYFSYYSWHCGEKGVSGKLRGICTNANSIGIEMCVDKVNKNTLSANDKDWYFTPQTVKSTVELVKYLMKELNIPADRVVRHYDVTGKICPNPFVFNTGDTTWEQFKQQLKGYSYVTSRYFKLRRNAEKRVKKYHAIGYTDAYVSYYPKKNLVISGTFTKASNAIKQKENIKAKKPKWKIFVREEL